MTTNSTSDKIPTTTLYWSTAIAVLAGAIATLALQRLFCRRRTAVASTSSHVEPLLVNGQLHIHGGTAAAAAATLAAKSSVSDLVPPVRRQWTNLVFLIIFSSICVGSLGFAGFALVFYFDAIWRSGFVAALLLGGIAFALRYVALWVYRNIILRRFFTTMQVCTPLISEHPHPPVSLHPL